MVVLTVNRIAEPLSAVTVAVVTGTSGPSSTHVPIGPDCGVTRYDEFYVNCTDLQGRVRSRDPGVGVAAGRHFFATRSLSAMLS